MATTIVMLVGSEDGFEAWRRLHLQYNPKLVTRQGQVLADFAVMVIKPARSIGETWELLTEMERRMKILRDLTDQGVSDMHVRSVLVGILDPMTRQHTASAHKQSESFEVFKTAVLEFTNAAGMSQKDVSKPDPMHVGGVASSIQCAGSAQDSGCLGSEACAAGSDLERENMWAVGANFVYHNCGRKGHFVRDCPSEGLGTGSFPGKGAALGKGFTTGGKRAAHQFPKN